MSSQDRGIAPIAAPRCIGLAPLADIPFNRARSNVKVKEYAAAGVPWVASAVGPYRGLGRQQGGVLVPDGRWGEALDLLLTSPLQRAVLRAHARRWARREAITRHVDQWERAFGFAIELARSRSKGNSTARLTAARSGNRAD